MYDNVWTCPIPNKKKPNPEAFLSFCELNSFESKDFWFSAVDLTAVSFCLIDVVHIKLGVGRRQVPSETPALAMTSEGTRAWSASQLL